MKKLAIPKEEMVSSGATTFHQKFPKVSCTVTNLFSNSF